MVKLKSIVGLLPEKKELDFGCYVRIEQKRYAPSNEIYLYKVIGRIKTNNYVDVPVQSPHNQYCHSGVVDVVRCVCCGVDEKEVFNFRVEDVVYANSAIDTIGERAIGLSRDDLAKAIFLKRQNQMYGESALSWEDAVKMSPIPGTAVSCAYELADAIIAKTKDIVVVEGER